MALDAKEKLDEALGELLRAADPVSKTVIRAYKHEVQYSENLSAISGSKFSTDVLERCAEFLDLTTRTPEGAKIFKNKRTLADKIILKIEAFFENTCDECNAKYQHHIADDDKPKIHCFLCLTGAHNCAEMNQKLDPLLAMADLPTGFVWVCRECRLKNDARPQNLQPVVPDAAPADDAADVDDDDDEDMADAVNTSKKKELPHARRNRRPTGEVTQPAAKMDICPLYKKAKCPHGLTGKKLINGTACKHEHPKRCIRFCRFGKNKKGGCTKGTQCQYYHPVLCRNALVNKKCTKENCTFTHLKGTRRNEEDETDPPRAAHDNRGADTQGNTRNRPVLMEDEFPPLPKPVRDRADTKSNKATTTPVDAAFLEQTISRIIAAKMQEIEVRLSQAFPQQPQMLQTMRPITGNQMGPTFQPTYVQRSMC